jgi:hypothetical protein
LTPFIPKAFGTGLVRHGTGQLFLISNPTSPPDAISGRLLFFFIFHHALPAAKKMLFTGERCGEGISFRDIDFTHRVLDHLINIA